ncbi:MAG: hypothetical protein N3H31_06100 [Candidatus Nezhaarchaeota archaeon]|nr:hypothetical protein [Candidatus Nezhaarchaeota archaeon]
MEAERLKAKEAFEELARELTGKDLETMAESSREFREGFTLR